MEGGPEVGDEGGVEGSSEEFLDDRQEVVEGSGRRQRGCSRRTDSSASSCEEKGMLDEKERDAARL